MIAKKLPYIIYTISLETFCMGRKDAISSGKKEESFIIVEVFFAGFNRTSSF